MNVMLFIIPPSPPLPMPHVCWTHITYKMEDKVQEMLHDVLALPWIAGHNDAMSLHCVTLTGLREGGKWEEIMDHDAVPTHSSLPTLASSTAISSFCNSRIFCCTYSMFAVTESKSSSTDVTSSESCWEGRGDDMYFYAHTCIPF